MAKPKLSALTRKLRGRFDEVQVTLNDIAERADHLNRECNRLYAADVGMQTLHTPSNLSA